MAVLVQIVNFPIYNKQLDALNVVLITVRIAVVVLISVLNASQVSKFILTLMEMEMIYV